MPYSFYKVMHLAGIFLTLLSLGAITLHVMNGGTKKFPAKKLMGICHGIGLFLALVGGFGLLARIGASVSQGWVLVKLVIWLIFGGATAMLYKMPNKAKPAWFAIFLLATFAAFLAQYKPF